jgi:hypothetical protein
LKARTLILLVVAILLGVGAAIAAYDTIRAGQRHRSPVAHNTEEDTGLTP